MLRLQKVQNKALRYVFNEKYHYIRNTIELYQKEKLDAINVTIYEGGHRTKTTLRNIIQDTNYEETILDNVNIEYE